MLPRCHRTMLPMVLICTDDWSDDPRFDSSTSCGQKEPVDKVVLTLSRGSRSMLLSNIPKLSPRLLWLPFQCGFASDPIVSRWGTRIGDIGCPCPPNPCPEDERLVHVGEDGRLNRPPLVGEAFREGGRGFRKDWDKPGAPRRCALLLLLQVGEEGTVEGVPSSVVSRLSGIETEAMTGTSKHVGIFEETEAGPVRTTRAVAPSSSSVVQMDALPQLAPSVFIPDMTCSPGSPCSSDSRNGLRQWLLLDCDWLCLSKDAGLMRPLLLTTAPIATNLRAFLFLCCQFDPFDKK